MKVTLPKARNQRWLVGCFFLSTTIQPWLFVGLDSWDFSMKRLLLKGTLRIPNHRAPNQQLTDFKFGITLANKLWGRHHHHWDVRFECKLQGYEIYNDHLKGTYYLVKTPFQTVCPCSLLVKNIPTVICLKQVCRFRHYKMPIGSCIYK